MNERTKQRECTKGMNERREATKGMREGKEGRNDKKIEIKSLGGSYPPFRYSAASLMWRSGNKKRGKDNSLRGNIDALSLGGYFLGISWPIYVWWPNNSQEIKPPLSLPPFSKPFIPIHIPVLGEMGVNIG